MRRRTRSLVGILLRFFPRLSMVFRDLLEHLVTLVQRLALTCFVCLSKVRCRSALQSSRRQKRAKPGLETFQVEFHNSKACGHSNTMMARHLRTSFRSGHFECMHKASGRGIGRALQFEQSKCGFYSTTWPQVCMTMILNTSEFKYTNDSF